MKTTETIIVSFKELLLVTNFKKIKVVDICEKAGVSRKTFYAHFRDKEDIIEKVVYENISKPVYTLHGLLSDYESATTIIMESAYQSLFDDKQFYEKIISTPGQKSIQDIIIQQISEMNLTLLAPYNMSQTEKEYMAYFYAASYAMLITKWIKEKMTIPPKTMAKFYTQWIMPYWQGIYQANKEINIIQP